MAVLLLLTTVGGCRSYGGYGTKEANMEAILQANAEFEQDLEAAQQIEAELETAAARDPRLSGQVEEFQSVLLAHETILADHKELAASLSPDQDTYRTIARAFGAILSEQELIRNRYEELLLRPEPANPRVLDLWDQLPDSRYVVVPPFYERLMEGARIQAMPEWIRSFVGRGRTDSLFHVLPLSKSTSASTSPATPDTTAP